MTIVLQETTTLEAHVVEANLAVSREKVTGFAQDVKTRTLRGVTSAIVARNRKTTLVVHQAEVAAEAHPQDAVVADSEVNKQDSLGLKNYSTIAQFSTGNRDSRGGGGGGFQPRGGGFNRGGPMRGGDRQSGGNRQRPY